MKAENGSNKAESGSSLSKFSFVALSTQQKIPT